MSVIVNGSTFETLSQPIYLSDGRQVQEIWVDGKKVYPDDMTPTEILNDQFASHENLPDFVYDGEIGEAIDYSGIYIFPVRRWIDSSGEEHSKIIREYEPIPTQELSFQDKYFKAHQFSNGGTYYIGTGSEKYICTSASWTRPAGWSGTIYPKIYVSVQSGMSYCFLHGARQAAIDYYVVQNYVGSLSKTCIPKLSAYRAYGDDLTDRVAIDVISGSFSIGKHTLYYSYADIGTKLSWGKTDYDFYTDGGTLVDDDHSDYDGWRIENTIEWQLMGKICGNYGYDSLVSWEKFGRTYTCLVRLYSYNSQNIR